MLKKYLSLFLLAGTLLTSLTGFAQISDAEAMNMAGLQRSLTQRMTKNYLMLGAEVRVDVAERQLQETIERFQASQQALQAYAPNAAIRASLNEVDSTWVGYRRLLEDKPQADRALAVLETSEQLLQQTQTVTDLMAEHHGAMGAMVNRAGWARVQTQRIAMLYMAKTWRVPAADLDAALDQSVQDFEGILKELETRGAPNEEIANAQRRARAHWSFTLKGIDLHASQEFVPTMVTVSTDSLFRQLNELTRLYAGLEAGDS